MQKFKIQKMDYDHIDDILQIEELCYGAHHWSKDSFVTELNNKISSYHCIIDEESNKCIGYMGIWKIVNEAHVTNLSIHPNYQHQKLAHRLLLTSIKECYAEKIKLTKERLNYTKDLVLNLWG